MRTGALLILLAPWFADGLCLRGSPTPGLVGTRTLGVDFGLRRVGVAVSSGFAPLPISVLPCGGDTEEDFERVASLVCAIASGEGATQVVLGMPYNRTGGEGEQAAITRAFANSLANAVAPRPVFLWDERFSSAEAEQRLNGGRGAARGELLDAVAAAIILEDFFAADDDVAQSAPSIPATRIAPSAPPPTARASRRPVPPSQADIKRAMRERAARQQKELQKTRKKKGSRR